jgi:hypothetical protein
MGPTCHDRKAQCKHISGMMLPPRMSAICSFTNNSSQMCESNLSKDSFVTCRRRLKVPLGPCLLQKDDQLKHWSNEDGLRLCCFFLADFFFLSDAVSSSSVSIRSRTSQTTEAKPNHITVHVTRTQSTKGFRVATGQPTSLITTVH